MRTIISTILGLAVVLGAPAARAQTVNPVAAPALAFAEGGTTLQESCKGLTTLGLLSASGGPQVVRGPASAQAIRQLWRPR